jgi:hypothetical protein
VGVTFERNEAGARDLLGALLADSEGSRLIVAPVQDQSRRPDLG